MSEIFATQTEKYSTALEKFMAQVRHDSHVIALLLCGSLVNGTVWEKSDIDLTMIVRDGSVDRLVGYYVDEDGIDIQLYVMEISEFKKTLQSLRGGGYPHNYYCTGRIVFSRDATLNDFFESVREVGSDDAALTFLAKCESLLLSMDRVEKWLMRNNDVLYARHLLATCVNFTAELEMIRNCEDIAIEPVPRAIQLNPELMKRIYSIPGTAPASGEVIRDALKALDDYLLKHAGMWARPLLSYLSDGEMKTHSMISKALGITCINAQLNYLAAKGFIYKASQPSRVLKNSRLQVEEITYYYIKEEDNNV